MKRLILLLTLFVSIHANSQQWKDAGTFAQFGMAAEPQLQILPDGTPHLIFLDFNNFIQTYIWNKNTMVWDMTPNPFAGSHFELRSAVRGDIIFLGVNDGSDYQVHQLQNGLWTQVGDLTYLTNVITGEKDLTVEPVTGDLLLAIKVDDFSGGAVSNSQVHRWDGTSWTQYGPSHFIDSPDPDLGKQEIHSDGTYSYVVVNQFDMGGAFVGPPIKDGEIANDHQSKAFGLPDVRVYGIDEGAPSSWDNFDGFDNWIINDPATFTITGKQGHTVMAGTEWSNNYLEVRRVSSFGVWASEPNINSAYQMQQADSEMGTTDSVYIAYREQTGGVTNTHLMLEEGGNWIEIGAPGISTTDLDHIDLELTPQGDKPYVLYIVGGAVGVRVFNTPPVHQSSSTPIPLCQDAPMELAIDDLYFTDIDNDSLWLFANSLNPGVVSNGNIAFNLTTPWSPASPDNHFAMYAAGEPGMTGTAIIEVYATDGLDTVMTTVSLQVNSLPTANNSIPGSACQNDGLHDLVGFGTPIGGMFQGAGVYQNVLYPSQAGVGSHSIAYIYQDINGCKDTATSIIEIYDVPTISFAITDADCGQGNGAVDATVTGGTPGYSIYWSNGSTTEDVTGLTPTMYYMNVTDANGCYEMKAATVSSTGMSVSSTQVDVMCNGDATGSIDLTVTGTGPFTYAWSNGETTEDISGLVAGQYEVFVSDGNCEAMVSVTITEPDAISTNFNHMHASCGVSNGGLTVAVGGGAPGYNYQWYDYLSAPFGPNAASVTGIPGGVYSVDVTDANGCMSTFQAYLGEIGAPIIVPNTIQEASCLNDGAIDIDINSANGIQSIQWTNGPTTEDVTGLAPGYYMVSVTDNLGCTGMNGFQVDPELPSAVPICIVSVDTLTNTNLIVWEKPVSTEISHFNLYRESSVAGVFMLVDSILYTETSEYNDTIAYPSLRSWRYKLTTVNNCGVESLPSVEHKTIHLVINQGLPGTYNLSWDNYEGFGYPTFYIYRHTQQLGWVEIDQIPFGNGNTASDVPPSLDQLDYMCVINPPSTCTSVDKAQDYNSSRSNRGVTAPGGGASIDEDEFGISVFPNPSTGEFRLMFANYDTYSIEVFDLSGKLIFTNQLPTSNYTLDLTKYASGNYTLKITSESATVVKKLILR